MVEKAILVRVYSTWQSGGEMKRMERVDGIATRRLCFMHVGGSDIRAGVPGMQHGFRNWGKRKLVGSHSHAGTQHVGPFP